MQSKGPQSLQLASYAVGKEVVSGAALPGGFHANPTVLPSIHPSIHPPGLSLISVGGFWSLSQLIWLPDIQVDGATLQTEQSRI